MHIAGHLLQNDADSRKAKARLTHKPGDKGHWLGIRIRTDCASLGLNQDPLCMCVCGRGRLHRQGEMHYSASDLATKTGTDHTCYQFCQDAFFSSKMHGSHAAVDFDQKSSIRTLQGKSLCCPGPHLHFAYLLDFFSRSAFLCRLTRCVSASIISKDRVTQSTKVGENALNFSSSFFSPHER